MLYLRKLLSRELIWYVLFVTSRCIELPNGSLQDRRSYKVYVSALKAIAFVFMNYFSKKIFDKNPDVKTLAMLPQPEVKGN
jgi:hypothetical protein